MNTRCPACGGPISPSKRVLKAAFGMEVPEDEESTDDPFSDATDFEPKGYAYAKGGEVERKPKFGGGKLLAALRGKLASKEHLARGGEAGKQSFAERMAHKYRSMHR